MNKDQADTIISLLERIAEAAEAKVTFTEAEAQHLKERMLWDSRQYHVEGETNE